MVQILWASSSPDITKTSVTLIKTNNETMTLSVGDFITYKGRPDGVRIEEFTGSFDATKEGPIGMTYLPWRKQTQQWATLSWNIMRGNIRHIIAYPCGMTHYGEHIDWNTVEHSTVPNIVPDTPHLDASLAPQ